MRLVAVIGIVVAALVIVGAGGAVGVDHTLTVSVSSGHGIVMGGADGATDIACDEAGGDCSEIYSQICEDPEACTYPEVVLEATNKTGWAFNGWTGCPTPSGLTCTVSMWANHAVSASFADAAPPNVALTLPSADAKLGGTINAAATATDNVGVSQVRFAAGGTTFATDSTPPFSGQLDTKTLADGPATITATAQDSSGNESSSSRSVTIDNTAPLLTVTGGPAEGSYTTSTSANFTFSASDATSGIKELTCARDTQDPLDNLCETSTSQGYTGLADGPHQFTVVARDAALTNYATVVRHWTVDTVAPTVSITGGPAAGAFSNSASGTFTFTSADANPLTRTCKLDTGAFGACTSDTTFNYSGLSQGDHAFTVRVVDPTGHAQTASRAWKIDTHAPAVSAPATSLATATPISPLNENLPVVVSWAAATDVTTSGVASYTLLESVNGGAFGSVGTFAPGNRTTTRFVAPGSSYRWRVRATDGVGNSADSAPTAAVSASAIQDWSTAVTYVKPWGSFESPYLWGGSIKAAAAPGASATFHVPANTRAVAVVALKGANAGSVTVSVDGGAPTSVSLHASSWQVRQVVFARSGLSAAAHTVTVTRSGTTGFVDVDGLVLLH